MTETLEFTCETCGEHIERERRKRDIPGLTPVRCDPCDERRHQC